MDGCDLDLRRVPGATLVEAPGVRAAFTRRDGPVDGALGGTNLSPAVGDDPVAVADARRWAASLLGLDGEQQVWGRQVHGTHVALVGAPQVGGPDAPSLPGTDALVTTDPGIMLGVMVADCVPVLLAAPGAIAVVHAGWRGLVAGIMQRAVRVLQDATGGAGSVVALAGPSIGVCGYEVGEEVASEFAWCPEAVVRVDGEPRPRLDLRRGVARALGEAGVHAVVPVWPCTCGDQGLWSHRRGGAGRQALVATLTPATLTPAGVR